MKKCERKYLSGCLKETFAKTQSETKKSIRYRVGILAHHNAEGVDYLLIFKKIPPYRAVGG